MKRHRSGWWRTERGQADRKAHWFDNDANVSVCGTLTFGGNRMERTHLWRLSGEAPLKFAPPCKVCDRMVDQERASVMRRQFGGKP